MGWQNLFLPQRDLRQHDDGLSGADFPRAHHSLGFHPAYVSRLLEVMSDYRKRGWEAARGFFSIAPDKSLTGSTIVDVACTPLAHGMPGREYHGYWLVRQAAEAWEGLKDLTFSGLVFFTRKGGWLRDEYDGLTIPRYIVYSGLSASADERQKIGDNTEASRSRMDTFSALTRAIRKLNQKAEEGVAFNGLGVAVLSLANSPLREGEVGVPDYNKEWLKLEREWQAKFPYRKIKLRNFEEVESDAWLSMPSIQADLKGEALRQSQMAGVKTILHQMIVVFETDQAKEEQRIAANAADPERGKEEATLDRKKNRKYFQLSQEQLQSEARQACMDGQFASNGFGWKSFSVRCPPEASGEMSLFDMNYILAEAVARNLGAGRHKVSDVLNNLKGMTLNTFKHAGFYTQSPDEVPLGVAPKNEGVKTYELNLILHMKDVDAIGKGFPPPNPLVDNDKSFLPWWARLDLGRDLIHPMRYAIWYLDQTDSNFRARWFRNYPSIVNEKGWADTYDKYRIYNGFITRGGTGVAHVEMDAPDIKGGAISYDQGELEFLKQLREWHERQENYEKEVISFNFKTAKPDEYTDPGHWNHRRTIFLAFKDRAAAKKNPHGYRIFADEFQPDGTYHAVQVIKEPPITPFEKLEEEYFQRADSLAYKGIVNRDGILVSLVDCLGRPQRVRNHDDPDKAAEMGRRGSTEGNRRRSVQQGFIRLLTRIDEAEQDGFDVLVIKREHSYDSQFAPRESMPGLDQKFLFVARDLKRAV